MNFTFNCTHCGQHISATAADAGVVAPCPHCCGDVTVPTPDLPQPVAIRPGARAMPAWLLAANIGFVCSVLAVALTVFVMRRSSHPPIATPVVSRSSTSPGFLLPSPGHEDFPIGASAQQGGGAEQRSVILHRFQAADGAYTHLAVTEVQFTAHRLTGIGVRPEARRIDTVVDHLNPVGGKAGADGP